MKVEIKKSQTIHLGLYRKSLAQLEEMIEESKQGLKELETALESISNKCARENLERVVRSMALYTERMLEVYNLRSAHPSISDSEFLKMAIETRRTPSNRKNKK